MLSDTKLLCWLSGKRSEEKGSLQICFNEINRKNQFDSIVYSKCMKRLRAFSDEEFEDQADNPFVFSITLVCFLGLFGAVS